ncbi:serine/threonine protein phosphatase [Acinetobacter baumannii]|uniref:metallophosphoesterase n=1 Tax=Acinetobacter baumannii TaxID=470 RepID=UPI00112E371B|nr:metallophosphoesterase [Acinetobacter baumannii]TPV24261.1 serine/threonine protein phosphatase [Acinetobacter baumannii]
MMLVKVWNKEIKGNLYAVGDIHGCYNLLMTRLNDIGFDFENDLLVAVGDLVDRGTQNIQCVELLGKPWFTSVRGNHEDLCIGGLHNESYKRCHIANGGEWFYQLDGQAMYNIAKVFAELPVVLEVDHKGRKFGFVHGHIEQNDWSEFKESFKEEPASFRDPSEIAMWGRERLDSDKKQYTHVTGVDAVIMGHTVTQKPCKRDNCYYIDTGAVHWGTLTILNLENI